MHMRPIYLEYLGYILLPGKCLFNQWPQHKYFFISISPQLSNWIQIPQVLITKNTQISAHLSCNLREYSINTQVDGLKQ